MPQIAFHSSWGQLPARFRRHTFGGFTDDLDISNDGVLQRLRRHEFAPARLDEPGDPLATLQHMVQVQSVVLQSGVASLRMRSRTYQCREFTVPIWTLIPSSS